MRYYGGIVSIEFPSSDVSSLCQVDLKIAITCKLIMFTKKSLEKTKIELDVPLTALHKKVSPTNFIFSSKEKCLPHDASRFATLRPIPEMSLTVCSEPMA